MAAQVTGPVVPRFVDSASQWNEDSRRQGGFTEVESQLPKREGTGEDFSRVVFMPVTRARLTRACIYTED